MTTSLASTTKGVASQDLFYLFIPGGKCEIKARGKSKDVSAVAPEFPWADGRCTNVKLIILQGAPLTTGENHDEDVLPGVGSRPLRVSDRNDGTLLDDHIAI
jgi:hypothetical protein